MLMNWHSVGVKVVAITMATLTVAGVGIVSVYAVNEKARLIDTKIEFSRQLLIVSESIRDNTLKKWEQGLFSTAELTNLVENKDEVTKRSIILSTVPTANAWVMLESKAKEGGFMFKAPSVNPRNARNAPDDIDTKALAYFKENASALEFSYVDEDKKEIRYFRPMKMVNQCETCHGSPETSNTLWNNAQGRDILGYPMENKHAGDLYGAFEIITPLEVALKEYNQHIIFAILSLIATLCVIGLTGYFVMSKYIISPLTEIAISLQNIAGSSGNLKARLKIIGKSEFAWVAGSFNSFVKKIAQTVDEISATSEQLAKSSDILTSITRATQQGAERQLQETAHVANSMSQMTSSVQDVANNAVSASKAASAADNEAESGKNIVSAAVGGINTLASEVENAASVIHELENDSNSIGEVLSVIQGIAEQTNLLALNAAIEAARAGEQGRGFAVVADEVRTLASRTQKSTLEIQQTIQRLQSRAKSAVAVMEKGRNSATASVQQAASAGGSIASISERIDAISGMNSQIANAAERQTAVVSEINTNINNISRISEETAVGAKNTAQACQDLLDLANQLRSAISSFRT